MISGFTTNFLKIGFKWTMLSASRMTAIIGDTDRKAGPPNSPEDKPRGGCQQSQQLLPRKQICRVLPSTCNMAHRAASWVTVGNYLTPLCWVTSSVTG